MIFRFRMENGASCYTGAKSEPREEIENQEPKIDMNSDKPNSDQANESGLSSDGFVPPVTMNRRPPQDRPIPPNKAALKMLSAERLSPSRCCDFGSYECQVPMPLNGRIQGIDFCISDIVAALNAANIKTVASCCGHGSIPGDVALEDGRRISITGHVIPNQRT